MAKGGLFGSGWTAHQRAEAGRRRVEGARQQARAAGSGFTDEVTMGLADPVLAAGNATFHAGPGGWVDRFKAEMAHKQAQDLNDATNYALARNAGRVAGVAAGVIGPAAPALARLGGRAVLAMRGPAAQEAAKARSIAKYIGEGATQKQAEALAKQYRGQGHHSVVSQAKAKADPFYRAFSETPYSKISGRTMETGDLNKLHARVDDDFYGTWAWSSKKAGLEKNGPLMQLWEGTPLATKVSLFGTAPASAGLFQALEEERLLRERGR